MKTFFVGKSGPNLATVRSWLKRFVKFADTYPLRVLWLIILFALFLSLFTIASDAPTMQSGSTDSWWTIAVNLIHGQGYSLCIPRYFPFCSPTNQTTAAREPVPVFLFALVALLSGESLLAAAVVEVALYLAVLIVVFFLTREWANDRAALLAAFLWSFYPTALDLLTQVSGDLLAALTLTLGMLFILRARRTNFTRDWLVGGIGLALAVMSRSAILAVVAVIIGGQMFDDIWVNKKNFKQAAKPFVILSVSVVLMMTPWLFRTQISLGRPIIGSSLVGYNMLRQSHLFEETGNYFRYVGGVEGVEVIQDFLEQKQGLLSGTENEAQMDSIYRTEAIKVILAHPVKYILLSGYRFLPLWFNWKIMEGDGHKTDWRGYATMVLQAFLLIFALIGILRNLYPIWPLWAGIAAISLAYMLVESQLRYLLSVIPLILSLSASGGLNLFNKYLARG
jgi:4-amino-4-deoxy-L-arabinose transferase-like glycosyltransferase